jgi:uncharacterized protein (DUF4213/DUF364 family)
LAGVAASPKETEANYTTKSVAEIIAQLSDKNPIAAAVALATINALLPPEKLSKHDAADWLSTQSRGRNLAIFGRFPFIEEEIRPFAKDLFVFEREPQVGEYSAADMGDILPKADIVAITGSAIINHTIDDILQHSYANQKIVILGPSTPLSSRLFVYGVDAMFGVRVADIDAALASVQKGSSFQKMQGLERVSLLK